MSPTREWGSKFFPQQQYGVNVGNFSTICSSRELNQITGREADLRRTNVMTFQSKQSKRVITLKLRVFLRSESGSLVTACHRLKAVTPVSPSVLRAPTGCERKWRILTDERTLHNSALRTVTSSHSSSSCQHGPSNPNNTSIHDHPPINASNCTNKPPFFHAQAGRQLFQ